MKNFTNKTIIISGASAGVGKATAEAFAKHKANLVLLARGQEALDVLAEALSKQTRVIAVAMDVCDHDACVAMLDSAQKTFGSIDVLVNNAGYHKRGPFENNTSQEHKKMVQVNLSAPLQLSALVLPYIKQAGQGAIVNVGSLAGRAPLEGAVTYAATKAALRAFTYALHDELRNQNIHVGLVSPGPIATGFILDQIDLVEDIVFSQPMSTAEQVAEAILKVAQGEQTEISLPRASGWLTTLSYLMPRMRRLTRPLLYAKGRKEKEKYRAKLKR